MARETNIHRGHREAMRRKLFAVGAGAFHPHELIEMLLYNSIPLCDTNPTAHRIIEQLGGLDAALSASQEELMRVKGVGSASAALLSLVRPLGRRAEESLMRPCDGACDYESYLRQGSEKGSLRLLLLDGGGSLLREETLSDFKEGAVSEISREIVKNAIECRATSVVLVRHCDGRALQPTDGELESLGLLRESLSFVDVRLADYVLVSGERLLRVGRAFAGCVYFDPDVALSFSIPCRVDEGALEKDVKLLSELLAFASVKESETARRLLSEFGSIGALLSTPAPELVRAGLSERAAALLSLVLAIYARGEISALPEGVLLDSAERQADYIARHYIGVRDERLSLLLLDAKSRPIAFIPFGDGGVGNTSVDLRKIAELALFHHASSLALAHNHPGGTLSPSPEDVRATRSVEIALSSVGVALDEHYVLVGRAFTPIRLYSEELLTLRPPEFYGADSFREIRRQNTDVYRPKHTLGLREK